MTQLVVALRAEARPLIDHYHLERVGDGRFPTYRGNGRTLVISGVGKVAAAAATASTSADPLDVWVNVGIGGHRDRATGELVRANRITDAATEERFYPTFLGLPEIDTAGVTTVDVPETAFASTDVFDMEASGFFQTAARLSTSELVHCVKIVSDNRATGTDGLTKQRVSGLVERNLDTIDAIITHLETVSAELEPARQKPTVEPFTKTWHFTTSQRRQLARLLARCRALRSPSPVDDFVDMKTASAVLHELEERLGRLVMERREF